jgi:excisionase family DNA binding protein
MTQNKDLSTFQVAELLGVDPGSVSNWIDRGLLGAYRTPGGHRRTRREDLLAFLKSHGMPVPKELAPKAFRIVVVDDQPAMTQMIAKAIKIEHPDFEVIEAHDGFGAGAVIATQKPHVVILDVRMPGMDGLQVCRMIKSNPATKNATILAITAYPSEEVEADMLKAGASRVLTKPLDLPRLAAEVSAAAAADDPRPSGGRRGTLA